MIKVTIGNTTHRESVMIDENTTIREALEGYGIDYSVGMTSLDGVTMQAGQMDKTFKDFGITEKCFLLNVVKADNAACIKVAGSALVIESEYDVSDIKKLMKHRPKALVLYDEKEPVYAVCVAKSGMGSMNQYGTTFDASSPNGKACVTASIPEGVKDVKDYVKEAVGVSILNLNKVERQLDAALKEIDDELKAIEENITVM